MANIKNIYSPSTRLQLRTAFGPRASEFFWLYETLYQFSQGKLLEDPDGKALAFRHHFQTLSTMLKMSKTPYDRRAISTILANRLGQCSNILGPILSQVETRTDNVSAWLRLNKLLVPLLVDIARDKGVYMQVRSFGTERWASFLPYPKSVEELERIKDVDPEGYDQAKTLKKSLREIDDRIRESIVKDGLTPERRSIMGRPAHTGTKPDGTLVVYDRDGDVLSIDSYLEKRKSRDQSRKNLSLEPVTITTPDRDIRKVDDVSTLKGDPEWFSITDDKAKQGGLTRVYECRYSADGHRVVTSGRYQGKYLDDLINSEGRLFEGTAYSLTLPNGKPSKVPVRIDPATREPYVTVAEVVDPETQFKETKLFIKVPSGHAYTEMRLAMKAVACNSAKIKRGCIPTVSYVAIAGSNAAGFYFEPKDYNAVRKVLKSLSLSKGALNLIQAYSRELKAIQDATSDEDNLKFYEMANVEGFRSEEIKADGTKVPMRGFSRKQKECFAWLDAKGGGGVAALDTGVGKCVKFDTLILTDSGWVTIDSLNPGISTDDTTAPLENVYVYVGGKKKPVKSFYYGGVKDTLTVRTARGFEITGSTQHPLLVNGTDWTKTSDLSVGMCLAIDRGTYTFPEDKAFDAFQCNSKTALMHTLPEKLSPDFARLLAYLIAEGTLTDHNGTITITQDIALNPEVCKDIDWSWNQCFSSPLRYDVPRIAFTKSSIQIRQFLAHLGLGYVASKDKCVPDCVMQGSELSTQAFLKAFVDAEGSVDSNVISITSASKRIPQQIQSLLLRFGILSSVAPKTVKGYEHNSYWRLSICGEDARKYGREIGFVSERKALLLNQDQPNPNPNMDLIPGLQTLASSIKKEIDARMSITNQRKMFGNTVSTTLTHISKGRRNATCKFLLALKCVMEHLDVEESLIHKVSDVIEKSRVFYYDTIVSITPGRDLVMDITVDDDGHDFVANGFVSHNTSIAIGHMLKTIQDGGADASYDRPDGTTVTTNGRFLFLCPPKLEGNVKKEVSKFVTDPRLLEDRLDVLTYDQFVNGRKNKTVPPALRKYQPWKSMPEDALWNPEQYIAVYCDEAHEIINEKKKNRMAAMSQFYHPRKILLTASPMTSDPSDTYKLVAVATNVNLTGMSPSAVNARTSYNRFVNRYTDRIGGRVVKLKDDPGLQDELKTWVKRNMYYADKTEVPETNLPQLISDTNALTMDPEVENAYRTIAGSFTKVIGAMVRKFQDRVDTAETRDKSIEDVVARSRTYAPLLRILDMLSNNPADAFKELAAITKSGTTVSGVKIPPSVVKYFKGKMPPISEDVLDRLSNTPAPKLQRAVELLSPQMIEDGNKRAILFSDDERFCEQTAKFLSESLPGYHGVGLRNTIKVYEGGKEVTSLLITLSASEKAGLGPDAQNSYEFKLPIKSAVHRKFPDLPANGQFNRSYKAEEWATFAFKDIIMPDKSIKTLTLLGTVFSHGQNLQAFSTVIHLDRDSWSNENMKQRVARAWRQGQDSDVQEYTLDCVYGNPKTAQDVSLDTVRQYFQQMEGVLFQQIIRESQKFDLTSGWSEVKSKSAKIWRVQNRIADLALSPYAHRSLTP